MQISNYILTVHCVLDRRSAISYKSTHNIATLNTRPTINHIVVFFKLINSQSVGVSNRS